MKFESTLVDERFIHEAIYGARLSYGNNKNMDSCYNGDRDTITIGPEDEKFCKARLAAGVQGEDKFLRTIPVSVRITAPMKWWVELDTYKIGTVRQSSSLMHRLASRGHFSKDDFEVNDSNSYELELILNVLNSMYDTWLEKGGRRNDKYPEWTDWQDLIPRSYNYTSHWTANYAVLRNIVFQRRNHRMKLWREFQTWVETLPHSWLITYTKEK